MPVIAMLLLLLGAPQASAADVQTLRGVVRDQTGAVLQGARVELADEAGGVLRSVVTDGRGEFLIDRVPPGAYALKIQFEGFRPATVRMRVAPRRTPPPQTVVLDLASQTQEVTVNAGTDVFTDNNNVAPRLSVAYAFDTKTAIRGGAGVFYDRAGDGPIREVLRSREERLLRVILLSPAYPDPFGSGASGADVRSIVTLSPSIQIPYTIQYGFGLERVVSKGTTVAMNYLGSRGVDLFRSHDVNAPPPPLYLARPDASLGQIRQIESTGRQTTHSLQLIARGRLAPRVKGRRPGMVDRGRRLQPCQSRELLWVHRDPDVAVLRPGHRRPAAAADTTVGGISFLTNRREKT